MKINSWRTKDVEADIRFLAWNFVTNLPLLLSFKKNEEQLWDLYLRFFQSSRTASWKGFEWSNMAKHLSCQHWVRLDLKAFRSHGCVVEELLFPHSCHFIHSQYCQRHPCLVTAWDEELTTSFDSFPWVLLKIYDYRFLLSFLVWSK